MFQNCGLVHNGLLASKASEIQYLYTLTENNTPQERRDAWSNVWNGV